MRFLWSKRIFIAVFFLSLFFAHSLPAKAVTVDVQGRVAPLTSQLNATLTADKGDVHQQEPIHYTITYSTDSTAPIPVTLEMSWTKGTLASNPNSQFDIVDYELGSGSQGFQNTAPIYDPVQHTVSWFIPAFSAADGEQTVTLRLRTNSNYQQPGTVNFSSSAVLLSDTSGLVSTVTHAYNYDENATSPGPSASPNPSSSAAPAAPTKPGTSGNAGGSSGSSGGSGTGQTSPFEVQSVTLRERTDTQATFHIHVSLPDQLVIRYGTDQHQLTNTTVLTSKAVDHFFTFTQLQPNTRYFFTIEPTLAQYLRGFTPRLVMFTTADTRPGLAGSGPGAPITAEEASASGKITDHITVISQYGNILNAAFRGIQTNNTFGFARGTLEYNFSISQSENADKVSVAFGKLSSFPAIKPQSTLLPIDSEFNAQFLPSKTWTSRVNVPPEPGTYMVILRRQDRYGSLGEESLGLLVVSAPLTVQDEKGKPLANIHMDLERMNDAIKLYEPVLPSYFAPRRGFVSDAAGNLFFPPVIGHYKATFSHQLYATKSLELEIDQRATQLPAVTMVRRRLGVFEWIKYVLQSFVIWLGGKLGVKLER